MYEAYVDSSHMTPGHMLLMGFAGMFSRLYADFTTLLDAVSAVPTVDRFKKADLVREASMLQVIFNADIQIVSVVDRQYHPVF